MKSLTSVYGSWFFGLCEEGSTAPLFISLFLSDNKTHSGHQLDICLLHCFSNKYRLIHASIGAHVGSAVSKEEVKHQMKLTRPTYLLVEITNPIVRSVESCA